MKLPFFNELEKAQTILIAGAGGGFDVFCGLPLYLWLKKAGKTVHLANLSSGALAVCGVMRVGPQRRCAAKLLMAAGAQSVPLGAFELQQREME